MGSWSEHTKRTLSFNRSSTTQEKTKAHKVHKACRCLLIIDKTHRRVGAQARKAHINYG